MFEYVLDISTHKHALTLTLTQKRTQTSSVRGSLTVFVKCGCVVMTLYTKYLIVKNQKVSFYTNKQTKHAHT